MEISYLLPQSLQNYDRILPETMEKDDQAWKITIILPKAGKFLINPPRSSTKTSITHSKIPSPLSPPAEAKRKGKTPQTNCWTP